MLTRVEHWATRALHNFFLSRAHEPFAWGTTDCALFVADGIEAMTGVDIAQDFRGRYATEEEAFALIKTVTGGKTAADAAAWCAAKFEIPELAFPLYAGRGDMVALMDAGRMITGLVALNGRDIIVQGELGLKRIAMVEVRGEEEIICAIARAWRV